MSDIKILEQTTIQVRRDILRMVNKVNSGHPGGSLVCAEFFVASHNVNDCRSETLLLRKCLFPSKKQNKVLDTHKL